MAIEILGVLLTVAGAVFFTAGTVGLIRFPDLRSRLHALTKADNLGLGLVLAGAAVLLGSPTAAAVLLVTWLLGLAAASVSARLLAQLSAGEPAPPGCGTGCTRPEENRGAADG